MCELESCLCNEGISDVQFTGKDCGRNMVDFRGAQRRGWLSNRGRGWCKCCSRLEGDGFSPEALFLGGERGRLTRVTVSPRLAPRATASSKVKKRGRFDLKLVRDRSLNLSGGGASVTLEGDGFEARGRCLVLGLGTAAVEAEFALRAEVATGVVGS